MTERALRKMIAAGESTRQEFKSWVKCKDYRQRKDLAYSLQLCAPFFTTEIKYKVILRRII